MVSSTQRILTRSISCSPIQLLTGKPGPSGASRNSSYWKASECAIHPTSGGCRKGSLKPYLAYTMACSEESTDNSVFYPAQRSRVPILRLRKNDGLVARSGEEPMQGFGVRCRQQAAFPQLRYYARSDWMKWTRKEISFFERIEGALNGPYIAQRPFNHTAFSLDIRSNRKIHHFKASNIPAIVLVF